MTDVYFQTSNAILKKIFDKAESNLTGNIRIFDGIKVLVEGTVLYPNVWLETQPMGGEMYGKRNLEIALNNHEIFMKYQRDDGRLPGMISTLENGTCRGHYDWLQGCFFATSAYLTFFLARQNDEYLKKLYKSLEKFDEYLWKYRDSDGDGCLESWCKWDTGEDFSSRLEGVPDYFGGEIPPCESGCAPFESSDFMGYSHCNRFILSKISRILDNGKEEYWAKEARKIREKIKDYLWFNNACYDRDNNNELMQVLTHNTLKAMYFNAVEQDMADNFLREHLLNTNEFWTEMPLPSIAINDSKFRNIETNNWSGQPEGLTYQRAIRALENYGHFAEVCLLGEKLIKAASQKFIFTQQFDPFTGKPSLEDEEGYSGYGPTTLSVLEYISRMFGVHIEEEDVLWSGLADGSNTYRYTQKWFDKEYKIENDGKMFLCILNEKIIFSCSCGVRIVTDYDGNLKHLVGISQETKETDFIYNERTTRISISPNEVYSLNENKKIVLTGKVPFDYSRDLEII